MATPMTPAQWRTALRAEGVRLAETSDWTTHGRDAATGKPFGPVHMVLIHHTAGRDSLDFVRNGSSALPGPLCHTHLAKDGTATMISAGRSNHAGTMARNAYNSFLKEKSRHPKPSKSSGTLDGNDVAYGIEIENLGDGNDPYPDVQYDQAVRWAAAICRFHGWTAQSVGGHKETSVEGKVDPSFPMDRFRADVQKRLDGAAGDGEQPPAETKPPKPVVSVSRVAAAARRDPGLPQGGTTHPADVRPVEAALVQLGFMGRTYAGDGSFGSVTVSAYAAFQRHLGYRGADADGVPGKASLSTLASRTGLFTVKN